ncbi:Aste57867_22017 [Aphanomyces stellatus]|uniref:Aste57867_22017 protein n=1 Tax=Aphanomyces stellatus TaxID=120398 RepID=A0A485LKF2_9STRA|nr:hypothetical protein As57867_021948 [Aphanomyces stellatus]VFT98685.1 Aste57867_22017 [Aphanomyces stellatus]
MEAVERAAEKILAADYLLVAVGAGFSADSGLPVYKNVADVVPYVEMGVDYQDLCDPYWVHEDLGIFLGFWGDSVNLYRDSTPHAGYDILKQWRQRMLSRAGRDSPPSPPVLVDPFYVYTSNVDSHCTRVFGPSHVYELHGNTEMWQCAGKTERATPCAPRTWPLPDKFRFHVNKASMVAQDTEKHKFLRCPRCKGPARPNVLMFRDKKWIQNVTDAERYSAWKDLMLRVLQGNPRKRLVVLEIGCGSRVKTVRRHCETLVHAVNEGMRHQATLIRINPDLEGDVLHWDEGSPAIVRIEATGLSVLVAMDRIITKEEATVEVPVRPTKRQKGAWRGV